MFSDLHKAHKPNYSLVTLMVAVSLTLCIVGLNNLSQHEIITRISRMILRVRNLEDIKGRILFLDESLTMSAELAAQSGDFKWHQRYLDAQPKLDSLLEEAIALEPSSDLAKHAAMTGFANYYLDDMENQALALAKRGQREQAIRILYGENYAAFKLAYAQSMQSFSNSLSSELDAFQKKIHKERNFAANISMLVFILISIIWLFIFRLLYTWQKDLVSLNIQLDNRVIAKTKELEQERQRRFESAKMAALGEVASNIAHEINTPLQVVRFKIHLLMKRLTSNNPHVQEIKEDLKLIDTMSGRIAKTVHCMLAFSRGSKKDPLVLAKLKPIIDDTLQICRARVQRQDITLETGTFPDNLMLKCRPTQVSQVLLNLLNNAFDAVENSCEKLVRVELYDQSDKIEIAVLDSGAGVDSKITDKIMQPYFTTKGIGKGTGLGLSISKNIMQEHGGELSFSRTENKFTCFSMQFPKEL